MVLCPLSTEQLRGPAVFQPQILASATVEALLPAVGPFSTTSLSVSLSASLAPPLTFYKLGTARCQHTAAPLPPSSLADATD